ncbi:MAG: REC domain-containing diguanylate cyclase [Arcobacter sp.]|nr:MAG: REC domain-containing diguanylate cyclase [Arcobacter sp.]
MLKVLLLEDSQNTIVTLEKEIKKTFDNIEVLVARTYKEALKNILKHGEDINLALLKHNILHRSDATLLDVLDVNNIKSIIICHDIENIPTDLVFEQDSVIDCIIQYDELEIKNIVNAASRFLKNIHKNILIVEDSKIQLSVLTKILEKMNLNVTAAHDGLEALEIIKNSDKKFELILTDYNMPNMDGMELTLKIRAKYDKDEVGIIILSSNNEPEISVQFLKMGANDFINKPYNETEVLTRINSNLDLIELFTKTKDMANRDFLTGAYNRRYFFETSNLILKKSRRDKSKIALAMIDIDKFKNINDTYGHDVGDKVICDVVNVLKNHLRASDLMARFGGEEFCVMLDNISHEDTIKTFEKIRKSFEENIIKTQEYTISCTVSIGIYYGMDEELDKMLKISDQGLYYCKENGRNQIKIST